MNPSNFEIELHLLADQRREYERGLKPSASLTDLQILDAFPEEAPQLIRNNIETWENELKRLWAEVDAARERHSRKEWAERETAKEIAKLLVGPGIDEASRHLTRLYSLSDHINGRLEEGRLTEDMINRAREFPIEALVEGMRRVGRNYSACCPLPGHDDTSPSFTVYSDGRGFYCFGCCRGGDAIAFVQERHGFNFPAAVRYLQQGVAA